MDNTNIYLISNLQTRINLLEVGDINDLRWDPENISDFDEWMAYINVWSDKELFDILNAMLLKVEQILSNSSVLKNTVLEAVDFLSDPEPASPDLIESVNLRRREELIYYRSLLKKCIDLIDVEVDKESVVNDNDIQIEPPYIRLIEKHLGKFRETNIQVDDYENLVKALYQGFKTGIFTNLPKPIFVSGIKASPKLGVPLKKIFMDCTANGKLTYEYLYFAKVNISLFFKLGIDKDNLTECAMYNCFTKTQ